MCFSATASFGTSAVLATVGVITLTKVKERTQIPFAVIPLMFAVQQFSEGLLWMSLSDPANLSWQRFPIYIFLVFAQLLWPMWIPLAILLLEKDSKRKKILQSFLAMGLIISTYLLYCLFAYPVSAEIQSGHIHYTLDFPAALIWVSKVLYFIPTVCSLFLSTVKKMPWLGLAILISFLATRIFFEHYLISVWCFFAAILSLIIMGIASTFVKKEPALHPLP